jgi:serine/threonine protein kinase/WD40 repeat protein
MPQVMPNSLADMLRQAPLLDAAQKDELARLEAQFAKPRDLAQELVRRGWLTHYQANQLLLGKGKDLVFGQYILLERIGEGGMGQVYKARQRNLERIVALKVIRKECLDKPKVISRFQREIRAAGHLAPHPNIVRAYDADQVNGSYYIAMEYIDGVDLAKLIKDGGPLPVEQACDLIRQAALGLQHAHEHGLVHRDIKPANLLVVVSGGVVSGGVVSGKEKRKQSSATIRRPTIPPATTHHSPLTTHQLKILDLGLARWEDSAGRANTHLTQMGAVMGTPDFIAPEQARNSHTCDIRADLYSLGCTLYYLIAGRIPFLGGSFAEKLIQHQMDQPEPLAQVRRAMLLSFHGRKGATRIPSKLVPVPDYVAAIVSKLMAKNPEDRLQTPAELAQALEQALERLAKGPANDATELETALPVAAPIANDPTEEAPLVKVATALELGRRPWTKRRWLPYSAVAAAIFLGAVVASVGNHAKPQANDLVAKQNPSDDAVWKMLQTAVRRQSLPDDELRAKLLDYRRQHPENSREVAALFAKIPSPLDYFDHAKIDSKQYYAWMPNELVGVLGMWRLPWANKSPHGVAVSPDGKWVAGGGDDSAFRIWDVGAPAFPWKVSIPTWGRVVRVAIAPDGALLAAASDDGCSRLYDVKSRKLLHTLDKNRKPVNCVAFHPRQPLVATAGHDGIVRIWDTAAGTTTAEIQTNTGKVLSLAFTPDGKYVFWGGDNHEVHWADTTGHSPNAWSFTANTAAVTVLAFHPDNRTLVCGGGDGTLRLCTFDGRQVKEKAILRQHAKTVRDAAFASDGQSFVSVGEDAHVILWDAASGAVRKDWELRTPIHGVACAPDSRHFVTANANGTVYVFRINETTEVAQR